ncbi:hypothetical protein CC80DRAFT_544718 [Byssothecium circinans]|uniref:Uncharacterized protein n=1 Tax=Byssothecium circinans TaxID=147558 RepID=A0A6A5U8G7_9PLEO|nr:hypothetical protein CC80DRAFT_544718 [Byssothecium circinans]
MRHSFGVTSSTASQGCAGGISSGPTPSSDGFTTSPSSSSSSEQDHDTTPPSSAQESRNPSVTSRTESPRLQSQKVTGSSLKSSLKMRKSAPGSLAVRFSLPEQPHDIHKIESDIPLPSSKERRSSLLAQSDVKSADTHSRTSKREMPSNLSTAMDGRASLSLSERRSSLSSIESRRSLNLPTSTGREEIQIASPYRPLKSATRPAYTKRLSTPAPLSRKGSKTSMKPPSTHSRYQSAQTFTPGSRVASFQSTASAPAVLLTTPPSSSQPPSQYNPLEHYIPCEITKCEKHYTPSLLGPTFYSPQPPHQLVRKKGLCVHHANQDLQTANQHAKETWEAMRQNAGRKTLGLIAAEFELYKQQVREDRALVSQDLEKRQRARVLGSPQPAKPSKKSPERGEEWDWRYSPRSCTRKSCSTKWYSPYDNRLYLFYHVPRPSSGLLPLMTLCPPCAREDVEDVEQRIEGRKRDGGDSVEWRQWCEQVAKDRVMETEYWEQAQERVVRERGVCFVGGSSGGDAVKKVGGFGGKGSGKSGKAGRKIRDICAVM